MILKCYYGQDIILKEAEKVKGIPFSFPGTILKIGTTGESVKVLQEQLNAVSQNYPLIPKLVVNSEHTQDTANAVKKFQKIFKLPVTGDVDFATWYKLSDVYVAVQKLA